MSGWTPDPAHVVQRALRGKSRVEFIHHAWERMEERGVTHDQVIDAIENPDETGLPVDMADEPDPPPRHHFRKLLGAQMAIDVVFEDEADCVRVISVWFRGRRLSGRF